MFPNNELRWIFFSYYSVEQLYYYMRCDYLNSLNEYTDVGTLQQSYSSWGILAAHMRCDATYKKNKTQVSKYLDEMASASHRFHIWDNIQGTPISNFQAAYTTLINRKSSIPVSRATAQQALQTANSAMKNIPLAQQLARDALQNVTVVTPIANKAAQLADIALHQANLAYQLASNDSRTANLLSSTLTAIGGRTAKLSGGCLNNIAECLP